MLLILDESTQLIWIDNQHTSIGVKSVRHHPWRSRAEMCIFNNSYSFFHVAPHAVLSFFQLLLQFMSQIIQTFPLALYPLYHGWGPIYAANRLRKKGLLWVCPPYNQILMMMPTACLVKVINLMNLLSCRHNQSHVGVAAPGIITITQIPFFSGAREWVCWSHVASWWSYLWLHPKWHPVTFQVHYKERGTIWDVAVSLW